MSLHPANFCKGIVLLEIALWKPASQFPALDVAKLSPTKFQADLVGGLREGCPHKFGQSFSSAIEACLLFKDFCTEGASDFEVHQKFQDHIVAKLDQAAASDRSLA